MSPTRLRGLHDSCSLTAECHLSRHLWLTNDWLGQHLHLPSLMNARGDQFWGRGQPSPYQPSAIPPPTLCHSPTSPLPLPLQLSVSIGSIFKKDTLQEALKAFSHAKEEEWLHYIIQKQQHTWCSYFLLSLRSLPQWWVTRAWEGTRRFKPLTEELWLPLRCHFFCTCTHAPKSLCNKM